MAGREEVDDLCSLDELDQTVILDCLRKRFENDKFYTYIGDVLVALNPCKPLSIYNSKHHRTYSNLLSRHQEPPHIFWTADHAYRSLVDSHVARCILVSGDSGAGKTESTKYVLKHLVQQGKCVIPNLVDKLEKVNPLLELFGNASTTLNTNSSRFGKLVELHYEEHGTLVGADVHCYTLEKSRVVYHNPGERNFHVFYSMFAGLSVNRLEDLGIGDGLGSFRILMTEEGADSAFRDADERKEYELKFREADQTLKDIGFSEQEVEDVYKLLAAVLLLTNVTFVESETQSCPEIDQDVEEAYLRPACDLLGIDPEQLVEALISNISHTNKGVEIKAAKTIPKAIDGRDALAKYLYCRLFEGIVQRINDTLRPADTLRSSIRPSVEIGILDISGFENLGRRKTGFEQLLINITNETLHQFFLEHMFHLEREDYSREGVSFADIVFSDNKDALDLLTKPPNGVLTVLEDAISQPKSTDETFVTMLDKRCKRSERFKEKSGSKYPRFGIVHYAGEVVYAAVGFLDKNTDTFSASLKNSVKYSENHFLQSFDARGTESLSRAAARKLTAQADDQKVQRGNRLQEFVSKNYRKSLQNLTAKLRGMKPLFVRCVKPNELLQPGVFNEERVQAQLRSSGVLEVAKVRKEGYPARFLFDDFVDRFLELVEDIDPNLPSKEKVEQVLNRAGIRNHQIGVRKVFLKYSHVELLDDLIDAKRKEKERVERERKEAEERARRDLLQAKLEKENLLHKQLHLHSAMSTPASSPCLSSRNSIRSDAGYETKSDKSDGPHDDKPEHLTPVEEEDEEKIFDNKPAYDMFRETERDSESSNVCETRCLQAARMFIYLVIIVGVLAAGVWAKLSLLALVANYGRGGRRRLEFANKLMIIVVVPFGVTLLLSFAKYLFGKKFKTRKKMLIFLIVMESAQSYGAALLLFRVFPRLDTFRCLVLMMCVAAVPTLLNFFEKSFNARGKFVWRCVLGILAAVAFLVQCGALASIHFVGFFGPETQITIWELPVSLFLVSLSWWENFLNYNIVIGQRQIHVEWVRQYMKKARLQTNIVTMVFKIATFLTCTYFLVHDFEFTFSTPDVTTASPFYFFQNDTNFTQVATTSTIETPTTTEVPGNTTNETFVFEEPPSGDTDSLDDLLDFAEDNVLVLSVTLCSFACAYLAGLACKLHMQRLGFSLPLLLVTPAALAFVYTHCAGYLPSQVPVPDRLQCPSTSLLDIWPVLAVAAALWVSLILLTYFIWVPQCERMAKYESMFIEPLRESVFLDTNLLLRRKNDTIENQKGKKKETGSSTHDGETPHVFVCATMWHETRNEMLQLLKSLFRLDFHCAISKIAEKKFKTVDPDRFNTEIHIIFDDAFEEDRKTKQIVTNFFVKQLIECMGLAAKSVAKGDIKWDKYPKKTNLPHGGRLTWTMPGGTPLVVHLKDKSKIRHRKRWSQIMYLYYLLGYKLFGSEKAKNVMHDTQRKRHWTRPYVSLLNKLKPGVIKKASNTFIFTLDGDVDFQPGSVLLLIDRMKKNKKVGAVCGRIHPIGAGPMVWYQQFEYAVGHWLQKAAENVFGCVLCCPGCFSLFRASALMDDNVMNTYTTKPSEARHFIQFEQGEDRWLCTLLLQQGYKIDYCAGADALTYAPETFFDFYVQRRRWAPSTMANIMDLLASWKSTTKMNDNISTLFIFYQLVVLVTSLLAPGTVAMMIAGSYSSVLGINDWWAYLMSIVPIGVFMYICIKCKTDTQLNSAAFFTSVYSIVMVIVTVGTILNIFSEDVISPNVLFLIGLIVIFVTAAIWHPKEATCLVHGLLYFMTVPSTFIFLTVYFLCNVHNVSWGTREGPKKEDEAEEGSPEAQPKKKKNGYIASLCEKMNIGNIAEELGAILRSVLGKDDKPKEEAKDITKVVPTIKHDKKKVLPPVKEIPKKVEFIPDPKYWMTEDCLKGEIVDTCDSDEEMFWTYLLEKYLYPLSEDKAEKKKISDELLYLRKNVVFGFFLINFMFSIALFQLQVKREELINFYIIGKYEPVSVAFLTVFALVLLIQFIAMLIHRWSTFQQLVSSTSVNVFRSKADKDTSFQEALKETMKLANMEPDIDYEDDLESIMSDPMENIEPDYPDDNDDDMAPDYPDEEADQVPEVHRNIRNSYDTLFRRNFRSNFVHYSAQSRQLPQGQSWGRKHRRWSLYDKTFGRRGGQNMSRYPGPHNV